MTPEKISQLTNYTTPGSSADVVPIVDTTNSITKKFSLASLLAWLNGTAGIQASALLNGIVSRRQGGSATIPDTAGTTNYNVSTSNFFSQVGSMNGAGNGQETAVTFPVAFTYAPIVIATPHSAAGSLPTWYIDSVTNTGFQLYTGVNVAYFTWLAFGI